MSDDTTWFQMMPYDVIWCRLTSYNVILCHMHYDVSWRQCDSEIILKVHVFSKNIAFKLTSCDVGWCHMMPFDVSCCMMTSVWQRLSFFCKKKLCFKFFFTKKNIKLQITNNIIISPNWKLIINNNNNNNIVKNNL
jgi:hypothetical protein